MAMTPQEAAAAGLGWVDEHNPNYGKKGFVGYQEPGAPPAAGAPGAAAPAPAGGAQQTVEGQAGAAATYSSTPGAAPAQSTTNQGTQDVVRNSYLDQATKPMTVDRNDPHVKPQADAYRANVERAARNAMGDAAEANGPYATGAQRGDERMLLERAGQAAGSFEAQLVGNELKAKRAEKQLALQQLLNAGQFDMANALQRELAEIDAQLKASGIDVQRDLGSREIDVKDKLGTGGLNVDLLRLMLNQQMFGDQLGFNIADREAYYNNLALQNLF